MWRAEVLEDRVPDLGADVVGGVERDAVAAQAEREPPAGVCLQVMGGVGELHGGAGRPPELLAGMAGMGWFSLPFAEEDGGDYGGPVELILIAEELGRASFDVAMCYIGVLIPGITVFNFGSDAQRAFIRDQVMTGRQRLAVALSEPDSGSDAAALRTSARDRGDHFLVNGQKMSCTGAGLPDTTITAHPAGHPRARERRLAAGRRSGAGRQRAAGGCGQLPGTRHLPRAQHSARRSRLPRRVRATA